MEQRSVDETSIFYSPTTKLLSMVSNPIIMQASNFVKIE